MVVIGLTGGIGAGKSTLAALLGERGAHVIDVDAVGRQVIAPGGSAAAAVEARFGTLDRRELADVVFNNEHARRDLEAISWPAIEAELERLVGALPAKTVVVLDMAVLAQGLGKGIYGPVVTVEAPDEVRVQRLVDRGMTEADARARMASQLTEQARRRLADIVVENSGELSALVEAADAVWTRLVPTATAAVPAEPNASGATRARRRQPPAGAP